MALSSAVRAMCVHSGRLQAQHHLLSTAAASRGFYAAAVYVSEARDGAVLAQLERVAGTSPGARLANLFVDEPYHRTAFTLVARSPPALAAAAVGLARAALALLDLRQHVATHPRLGSVDHISCHPLPVLQGAAQPLAQAQQGQQQARQQQGQQQHAAPDEQGAAAAALAIARELGGGAQALPVYTYGWAHPQQRPLDEVRRQLGYFQGAATGSWQGALQAPSQLQAAPGDAADAEQAAPLPLPPCFGPAAAPPRAGVCCVGAAAWVVNYNVLLLTADMAAARAVARGVSQRGGGLAGVQAMALRHSGGIEVACNLLGPGAAGPGAVLAAVSYAAAARGLAVGAGCATNKSPEQLVAAALALGL